MTTQYTYSIFDGNPAEASGLVWHDADNTPLQADSIEEAKDAVRETARSTMERIAASDPDAYEPGDEVWWEIHEPDESRVCVASGTVTL